jgi:hypothetical protein
MDKIINQSHNAFIKRINITEGIMSLHEILHETKQKGKMA